MADESGSGFEIGIIVKADKSQLDADIAAIPNDIRKVGGDSEVKIKVDASDVQAVAAELKELSNATIDVQTNVEAAEVSNVKPEQLEPSVDLSAVNAAVERIEAMKPVIQAVALVDTSSIAPAIAQAGAAVPPIQVQTAVAPPVVPPPAATPTITPTVNAAPAVAAIKTIPAAASTAASQATGFFSKMNASLKANLSALRQVGGRGSGVGQLGQLLAGGGAVIGVALIGRAIDQATAKMAELSDAFRKGETDAAGIAVGIGESIPVIGGFVSAGQNIREIFTGEKAALEEINKDIELGNQLLEQRQAAANIRRQAVQGFNDQTEDVQSRTAIVNAPNEIARHKLQIDVEYRTDSRGLAEKTRADIEARKKALLDEENDITKHYGTSGKNQGVKTEKIQAAQRTANNDVAAIQSAADADQKALDQWQAASQAKASGIGEELKQLNEDIASKLATTDTAKIDDYRNKMIAAGHSTDEAAQLAAKFADSLKADHVAAFSESLQDLDDKLQTIGDNSKESAINEMALQLAKGGVSATDAAAKLEQFRQKYDAVQEDLKRAAFGDAIKGLQDQTAKFGTTPVERANKLADFSHATAEQREQYIKLTVEVEHEEKLQQVADKIKSLKEQAASIPALNFGNPTDADEQLAKLKASEQFRNATPDQQQQLIKLTVQVEGAEKAEQLYDKLKSVNVELAEAGKSDIDKQIDEMNRLADASGRTAEETKAINDARAKLEQSKVADFVRDQNEQAKEVGESEPDKAVDRLKSQGVTDPKLLADAWQSAANKAGAELKEAVESPLDKLAKQVKELDQLRDAGAISEDTYNKAVSKDQNDAANSIQGKSIEDTFKDNLKKELLPAAYGASKDDKQLQTTDKNTKSTDTNTSAVNRLSDALGKGLTATAVLG